MKYPKILNRSKLLILFIVFIFSGCSPITTLKFKNIVKVNDVYYQKTSDLVSLDELGSELGKVKLTTPKTNGKYEFVNYEASKLEVGTKIYKLENEDFIAVEIKDIDTIYQKYKRISPNEIIEK
ncbi:hypothetical protein [Thomasclavelia cocleata]|jgi:hypothetical protein|uniref:hypothetical protein n=1 Tax=Thomasclavelia cocleata TaxID=69824 RepID=UPI00241D21DC|nr:hypothetical protein [Thomasclavelia cocleata]MCI9132527.1 hypothetical protein [Thomasclavelia cocleata]